MSPLVVDTDVGGDADDAVALVVAALDAGFVDLAPARVVLDDIGRMRHDEAGTGVRMAVDADHGRTMSWLDDRLGLARPACPGSARGRRDSPLPAQGTVTTTLPLPASAISWAFAMSSSGRTWLTRGR